MKGNKMTEFTDNEIAGQVAVDTFIKYLDSKKKVYRPANMEEQRDEIDVVIGTSTIEVKSQTIPSCVVIEEKSVENQGWIYTSKAKWLAEVCGSSIILIDMTELRKFYMACKQSYRLIDNRESNGKRGGKWISQFRILPINDFKQYVTVKEIQ